MRSSWAVARRFPANPQPGRRSFRVRPATRGRALAAACLLALGVIAGCGGSEEDDVRDVVKDYIRAFTEGDGDKACSLLTEETRETFVSQFAQTTRRRECGEALQQLQKTIGPDASAVLRDAEVKDVQVKEDKASVTLEARQRSTMQLEREGDDWRILDLAGVAP